MLHPSCDAFGNFLEPCGACDQSSNVLNIAGLSKPSRAARRQHRARRSILRSLGNIGVPPGLDVSNGPQAEKLEDLAESGTLHVVELARRLQRIELLLFAAPEDSFRKLDDFITGILSEEWDDGSDEEQVGILPMAKLPESCEVFSLDDDMSLGDEGGLVQHTPPAADGSSACSQFALYPGVDVEDLLRRVTSSEEEINKLTATIEDLESTRATLVTEVVSPITQIVNTKFDPHESQIQRLQVASDTQNDKIERCLKLMENFVAQGDVTNSSSMSEHDGPKTPKKSVKKR
jgi:hypothetical protein